MITREEIENIALLSKLSVTEDEMEKITRDMEQMMEFADIVANTRTDETQNVCNATDATFMREDTVGDSLPVSDVGVNAPEFSGGYYILRKEALNG